MTEPAIIPATSILPGELVVSHIQDGLSRRKSEIEQVLLTALQPTYEDYLREFHQLAGLRAALEFTVEARKKYRV